MKRKSEINESSDSVKVPKLIPFGSNFRKKLKTNDAINALKEFVTASKERDVITEYINVGGSAKELINLLKQFDGKKDLVVASTVFAALQAIIIKAVDDLLLIQKNVEETCEELLCSYQMTIQNMLNSSSSTTSYRKIILKLFASMITLSGGLAKKILALFPINMKLLKILTESRGSSNATKLRTCFIHFLLSFLFDEDVVQISELLKKKGLLSSIILGLMNDKPETVILVLSTLRLKIVENVRISKTLKIHTFNTPVLRSLFKLYDYKLSNNPEVTSCDEHNIENSVHSVREAVHSLLILLCTSNKKGILFRDRNSMLGKSQNQLILTLLEEVTTPWRDNLKSIFVIEILKVCPEFLKTVFIQLEPHLQPNNSNDWIKSMIFLQQIIEKQELDPEMLREQSLFSHVTSSCFPKLFRDHCDSITHRDQNIRFYVISVMELCLRKLSMFLENCSVSMMQIPCFDAFKDYIEQFLNKKSVSCASLIAAWNMDIDTTADSQNFDVSNYYNLIADTLLFYRTLCPISFNQLLMNEEIDLKKLDIFDSNLHFKRAQLVFLISNPKPGNEQFSSSLRQFISSFIEDGGSEKHIILENMFQSTGFYEGFDREVLIWINSIQKIPVELSSIICDLMVDVFMSTSREYNSFMNDLTLVSCDDDVTSYENANLPADLEYFLHIDESLERFSKPCMSVSPTIPALLKILKSYEKSKKKIEPFEPMKLFVLRILVHLLHLQSNPKGLISIVEKYSSLYVDSRFFDHLQFWSHDKLKKKMFTYLLPDEEIATQLSTMFVKAKYNEEVSSLLEDITDTESVLLWHLCTYYSVRLHEKYLLEGVRYELLKNTFLILLDKLSSESMLQCLKFTVADLNFINNFSFNEETEINPLIMLLVDICDNSQKFNSFSSYYSRLLTPYRQRLILFLLNKHQRNEKICWRSDRFTISSIIRFVMLNGKTAALLLNTLSSLPLSLFIDESGVTSGWCSVIECLFQVTSNNLEYSLENAILLGFLSKIPELLEKNVSVDCLENSILNYLRSFPHHILSIPQSLISKLIDQHSKVDKIASCLLPHYPMIVPMFLEKRSLLETDLNELLEIFHNLSSVCNTEKFLEIIYNRHFQSIISWIDGNGIEWEMKYTDIIIKIFERITDENDCFRLCQLIESKWSKVNLNATTFSVMTAIFITGGQLNKFIELLMLTMVNKLPSSIEEINWMCNELSDIVETVESLNYLLKNELWLNFVKMTLKISLQTSNSSIMRALRLICDKTLTEDDALETNRIFQMTISHSEFINLILGSSEIKCELVEFYLLLMKKNKSLMSSNHVPLLLGAYNATLSKVDQLLLQVLQFYETNKIRFRDCKPYLWGDAAVTHHSIRTEISVSLKRQPQPNQVLELLDIDIVKNTIRHSSLDRILQPRKEIHPSSCDVYDLSFMLPLMSHLLAPESRVSVQKFTRSGALALVLVSLSSQASDVRMAAFHCLQRFQSHLISREKEIQLWDHFINALKNGIISSQSRENCPDTTPKLPTLVSNFLAHMSLIISEPLHPLYVPLTNFLLAKTSFDVNTIPNFLALFYSVDMKNRDHQEWILRIIKDGMRRDEDWTTAQKCFLFKLMLQYYSSASSNETINVLIMEILCNALLIPNCKTYLITKFGLLSWLYQVIENTFDFNKNVLSCLISVFQSLKKVKNTSTVIFTLLILLRKLHSTKLDLKNVENLLEILSSSYLCSKKNVLTKHDILFVINFAKPYHNAEQSQMCKNCLTYSSVVRIDKSNNSIYDYLMEIIRKYICDK